MGEDELGPRSCTEHVSIKLRSRWSGDGEILSNGQRCECTLGGGAWHFLRLCQFLNGRLTGVRKVLCRAGEIGCKRTSRFLFGIWRWFHDS